MVSKRSAEKPSFGHKWQVLARHMDREHGKWFHVEYAATDEEKTRIMQECATSLPGHQIDAKQLPKRYWPKPKIVQQGWVWVVVAFPTGKDAPPHASSHIANNIGEAICQAALRGYEVNNIISIKRGEAVYLEVE